MKKTVLLSLMLVLSSTLFAQQEASNWFFGDGAGITFNNDGTITPTTGNLFTDEGCTSISDNNGNLLFYTDGIFVYDRNNALMPNGTGLDGNPSSTQSGLIVPKPGDPHIYYIFTVDTFFQNQPDSGFHYSEVDMTLNGGLGDVTIKNIDLLDNSSEKISAVLKDCQSQSIWVVTFSNETGAFAATNSDNDFNTFHAYEVTTTGVNATPVSSTIPNLIIDEQRGYLKFSPDGTKLAVANIDEGLFLFDFDAATGSVTNVGGAATPLSLFIPANNGGIFSYGLEFSPNSQYLYVASYNNFFDQNNPAQNDNPDNHNSSLFQFDVTAADVQASAVLIDERNSYRTALQLGPDGRIYRTASDSYNNGLPFLTYINSPNETGLNCDYDFDNNRIDLLNNSRQGLPPFIASFFVETVDIINNPDLAINANELPLCDGDTYTLSAELLPDAVYTWSVDGIVQGTQPVPNEFEVTTNGLYEVLIEFTNGDCNTFEGVANVMYFSNVFATAPANSAPADISINVCDDANNDQEFSFTDFDVQIPNIIGAQDPINFNIKYYTSLTDATNDENEIAFPFTNTVNNQPIFVRVENRLNPNCFTTTDTNTGDTIQFFLNVFDTPVANSVDPVEDCDTEGDTTDGVITFTLTDYDATILGTGQDAADYTITYHASSMDAMNGTPVINNTHQNTPFNDEVFYRITNNANTDCFSTNSFFITVNLTPEANDVDLFQCDEDGISDGRVTFNITEKNDEVTGGNPAFTVEYFLNMSDAMNGTDAVNGSNYENISNPQILVSKVTDPNSGCYSLSEFTLRVSATSANDAYLSLCDTDDEEDGFIDFDLSLADAQVLDGLPAGLDLAYYLTLDDALLEQNPLENDYRNEVAFNQTIFVRVENDNDCYGINEVELEVFTLPNVETEFETLYCFNDFPEPIVINGGVINDVPNNYYYNWSTGETTIEIEVNTPGTYTVEVSNVEGCSKTRTVTVLASNIASIDNVEVTDASQNNTVTVIASGEGDYVYALDDPNGPYQVSNVFENVNPGIYTVYVRDENGCGISEELISVVGFPKFFTPNGDNQNDFWQVKGISDQFQPGTVIYIYDRHGKLISEVNPLSSGWDGNYNGNPMPASDYWFSVTLEDGRTFSSYFALKR